MIRILIVDDSGFMRLALKKMLEKSPQCEIVAQASTAAEAVKMAAQLRPDIITMDIEMPGGSGVDATKKIMQQSPCNIIMVSSLTSQGAKATFDALKHGAVDYIPKASSFVSLDIASIEKELHKKIFYWAEHGYKSGRVGIRNHKLSTPVSRLASLPEIKPRLIVIGASTGGPKTLPEIFSLVECVDTPIVIALHMPEIYTESFSANMASRTGHRVLEGRDGMTLESGMVVVAPGGRDTKIMQDKKGGFCLKVLPAQEKYSIHPSVNCLFASAIESSKRIAGIILTGMGDDGAESGELFKRFHLPLIAQDQESSFVYGMPKVITERGLASESLSVPEIAGKINQWQGNKPSCYRSSPGKI
ncbi:MAG: chemotaxis-specific protein-glutamate methyltransferase CheB [Pseudomonadales bacterium]|nr:chemotaxis-specific protein-glutamate methyltransferase CheB [Pseudomonadales bacterium]